jgi:arabinogalactan oligomer/maltooligosaccharide transport system permease protein
LRILRGNIYAVIAKIIFVSLAMVTLGYLMMAAFGTGDTNIAIFLAICILLLAFTYFTNISVPLKFFAPGLMFLGAFVIVPVVFTLSMAGFKYQTGNMLSKEEAISTIKEQGTAPDENGTAFDVVVGYYGKKASNSALITSKEIEGTIDPNQELIAFDAMVGYYGGDKENIALLSSDTYEQSDFDFFISTKDQTIQVPASQVKTDDWGIAQSAPDFQSYSKAEINDLSDQLLGLRFRYDEDTFMKMDLLPMDGFTQASLNTIIAQYEYYLSTADKRIKLDPETVIANDLGLGIGAPNFTKYTDSQLGKYSDKLGNLKFKYEDPYFIRLEGLPVGGVGYGTVNLDNILYDAKTDTFSNYLSGAKYEDDGRGNFRNVADKEDYLDPGWRQGVWFENFTNLVTEPKIREPLIAVFIWTIVFAISTVITQFALGLLVAIAMDKKLRGRGIYRSLMILPYAMPSIMSILIWGGMLDRNGAINSLLNLEISWLQDPWMAKVSVLLVNLWLGFPYFYLICAGSLQAIPKELAESASIDGANARQIFRLITLPLLLRMLTPLLIASFAFNFNNFNIVYLLTGGGPKPELDSLAGATDILISYTYKLAFDTTIQNYGLASAISVVIFVIVASISMYGIRKSKVLDDFA